MIEVGGPMKFSNRLSPVTWLPLVTFIASAWVAAGLFYYDLPSQIPSHWSVPGKADGFTPKPWGAFLFPILMTLIWIARPVIRFLSLPRYRHERFPGAFDFRIMLTVGCS
jgi:immunity protein, SdpI family